MESSGTTWEEWKRNKLLFGRKVETKLGRRLEIYEKQMFLFPEECAVCTKLDDQNLTDCEFCAASYCEYHIDSIQHKEMCEPLAKCYDINLILFTKNNELILCYFPKTATFQDMDGFIDTYVYLDVYPEFYVPALVKLVYSQHLFRPLTLLHAMRLLNYAPERKDLIIHVVNATQSDVDSFTAWNVLIMLKLIDVSSLMIVMIGPEFTRRSHALPESQGQNKECSFEFHVMSYENYVNSSSFVKPDLVVGFISHIKMRTLKSCNMWELSVRLIAKQNCPFVFTTCMQECLDVKAEAINTIQKRKVDYIYKGNNPFASLRPHRYLGPQKVFYMGQYLVVYKNL
ncbi:PREDICTED: uncharacterized protein LOC105560500 isoform X2 [Vollenhovia emeryi]|nr:PREDICTED: uncharacterized protein LOC105560500 isoform X2 [Vollenhovia emeryi]